MLCAICNVYVAICACIYTFVFIHFVYNHAFKLCNIAI